MTFTAYPWPLSIGKCNYFLQISRIIKFFFKNDKSLIFLKKGP